MATTCSIVSCEATAIARGWCSKHYGRWMRSGDPNTVRVPNHARICVVEDCQASACVRGWCQVHYTRWQRHGDPLIVLPRGLPARPVERVWERVDRRGPDECWPWTGATNDSGYGQISIHGQLTYVHRVVYELTYGDLGDLFALHACDNPPCCNPAHLFAGTHQDNMDDMVRKGRRKGGAHVTA